MVEFPTDRVLSFFPHADLTAVTTSITPVPGKPDEIIELRIDEPNGSTTTTVAAEWERWDAIDDHQGSIFALGALGNASLAGERSGVVHDSIRLRRWKGRGSLVLEPGASDTK